MNAVKAEHDPINDPRSLGDHWLRLIAWFRGLSILGKFIVVAGMAVIVAAAVWSATWPEPQSTSDKFIHEHYPEWRAECEAQATAEVEASGFYTVGGNHWVGLVNHCINELANDQTPAP